MKNIKLKTISLAVSLALMGSMQQAQAQWSVAESGPVGALAFTKFGTDAGYQAGDTGATVTDGLMQGYQYTADAASQGTLFEVLAVETANNVVFNQLLSAFIEGGGLGAVTSVIQGRGLSPLIETLLGMGMAGMLTADVGLKSALETIASISLDPDKLTEKFSEYMLGNDSALAEILGSSGLSAAAQAEIKRRLGSYIEQQAGPLTASLLTNLERNIPVENIINFTHELASGNASDPYRAIGSRIVGKYIEETTKKPFNPFDLSVSNDVLKARMNPRPYMDQVDEARALALAHRDAKIRVIPTNWSPNQQDAARNKIEDEYRRKNDELMALKTKVSAADSDVFEILNRDAARLIVSLNKGVEEAANKIGVGGTIAAELKSIDHNCSGEGLTENMQQSAIATGKTAALLGMSPEGNNLKAMIQCNNQYLKVVASLQLASLTAAQEAAGQKNKKEIEEDAARTKYNVKVAEERIARTMGSIVYK